ncbi:hypothetical protein CH63R_06552 [Colletotrichum higginsianum IMI 349063]|uniref:Uncharacterized protein n=1 Tax=Colletotrichum higginsianum (strain IMI 349063) TaxID=759273 RepID=A0A1B7YFY6_COLHI|nr:hypothetical protein CH63R_06552 [Colletotrichum higginsianum IMI 349063]OBR10860.1 hypothetical protein CH63R_06552 [Colletotrichum higginsianum IMI 349063]
MVAPSKAPKDTRANPKIPRRKNEQSALDCGSATEMGIKGYVLSLLPIDMTGHTLQCSETWAPTNNETTIPTKTRRRIDTKQRHGRPGSGDTPSEPRLSGRQCHRGPRQGPVRRKYMLDGGPWTAKLCMEMSDGT